LFFSYLDSSDDAGTLIISGTGTGIQSSKGTAPSPTHPQNVHQPFNCAGEQEAALSSNAAADL
jgi:hypothetical protein